MNTTINTFATANVATASTQNLKQLQQQQTAQQLVRENVQYLIEQLEAGHSEGCRRSFAQWRSFGTTRSPTSSPL